MVTPQVRRFPRNGGLERRVLPRMYRPIKRTLEGWGTIVTHVDVTILLVHPIEMRQDMCASPRNLLSITFGVLEANAVMLCSC